MTAPVSARILCVSTLSLSLLTSMFSSPQEGDVPKNIAESVGGALHWTEGQFLGGGGSDAGIQV
jgi:hypothetical protein